jgi:hypothetical protein
MGIDFNSQRGIAAEQPAFFKYFQELITTYQGDFPPSTWMAAPFLMLRRRQLSKQTNDHLRHLVRLQFDQLRRDEKHHGFHNNTILCLRTVVFESPQLPVTVSAN